MMLVLPLVVSGKEEFKPEFLVFSSVIEGVLH